MKCQGCRDDHKKALRDAVREGLIRPLSPHSFVAVPEWEHAQLMRAVMTRTDFEKFARTLLIHVEPGSDDTQEACCPVRDWSIREGQERVALLPAAKVISLVDVVDILVRAEDPERFAAPDSWRTPGWEIIARRVRSLVDLAAETGALRVHRRGNWMQTAFDRNESAEYDVTADDLKKWLETSGMAYGIDRGNEPALSAEDDPTNGNDRTSLR